MLISDKLTNNIKTNLISIEKNINKILNEIKSFNPKTSHQNILKILQDINTSSTISTIQKNDKNIQNLNNILLKLQTLNFYKEHPKYLKNIQKEILNLLQKSPKNYLIKKSILQLKNEIKNFTPTKSPQKIADLINKLEEDLTQTSLKQTEKNEIKNFTPTKSPQKIADLINKLEEDLTQTSLKQTEKNEIKSIINQLEKIEFYKNRPNTLNILKEKLSNLIAEKNSIYSYKSEKIAQTILAKAIMLLHTNKDTTQIKKFIKNIENFLKTQNSQKFDTAAKLQNIQESFDNIKIVLSNKNDTKELLKSIQRDIKALFSSLKIIPKFKKFNTLIKDTLLKFKTGKIKLLNQTQIIKNIGNITKNIDNIILNLPKDEKYIPIKQELLKFSQEVKHIDLKQNLQNSGILYESKLFEAIKDKSNFVEIPKNDIKGILLTLKNDTNLQNRPQLQNNIQNTLSQINIIQANALLNQNFISYIPFYWDDLKDGYFSIAKFKKKDGFSCKIELDLNKYGKIDILMLFYQELLSIKMDIKDKNFKNILQKNLSILQSSLNTLGFKTSIFFADKRQNCNYVEENNFFNTLEMDIKA